MARSMVEAAAAGALAGEPDQRLAQIVAMIEHEEAAPGFASRLLVDGLTEARQALLARAGGAAVVDDRIRLSPVRLRRVTRFVADNLSGEISPADMAAVAELSPYHFARVFKATTGVSPHRYVRARRIERARDLLSARDDAPLSEVALACGFANQSHFTAAFTHAVGVPPGRFRRALRT